MNQINILIVDDHPVLQEGLQAILNTSHRHSFRFTFANNGIEAMTHYKNCKPSLIITDIRMPDMDGIQLTREIRRRDKVTPILMMTVLSSIASITRAVEFGVNGYLTKMAGTTEIVLAAESLLRGENYFGSDVSQLLLNNRKNQVETGLNVLLTDRELQILRLISKDYSQEEMADELSISRRTVEGHARNLRSKLNAKSSAGMVMNAIKQGLLE
ncbi:MAG: response regulator transcription factor [bacterium]|nr:response regulator transcription factor [bacterium]